MSAKRPSLDLDLYADAALRDPVATYAAIRDAGPAVWLKRHRLWAIGRYDDVRAALKADDVLVSGRGIAVNPIVNALGRKTTLFSDGATHDTRRKLLIQPLTARSLQSLQERIDAEAVAVVERLAGGPEFDGVADFASALPVKVIADLVGVRVDSDQLLRWGRSTFDALGPINRRFLDGGPAALGLVGYTKRLNAERVVPGSWAASVLEAAERGEISKVEAKNMVIDYVAPSLDTTILAAGHLLWLLGTTPGLWDRLRTEPDLIPAAVVEGVRLASPIRGFTRRVARDTEVGGTPIRRGAQVALLFAAADLDERRFPDPTQFSLDRPPGGNLAWGNGPHTCVGIHLSKLELQALLRAMVGRVERIEVHSPEYLYNNTLQGFERFRARLV